jgi:UDP-N-acetylglucosamine transferase subunit ALG13
MLGRCFVIFVTVGTQLAFDRLIAAVDAWSANHPAVKVFAQIGPAGTLPEHMKFADFVAPDMADELFMEASLIVSHAGMGSILTALRYKKPILIMPRRASLGEHRNDHQLATAKWLGNTPGVAVAWDEKEISNFLDRREMLSGGEGISDFASPELIQRLKAYIHAD